MSDMSGELDPRFEAGVDLLRRTGAHTFRVGFSDESEGLPVAWYAVVVYAKGAAAAEGGLDPVEAVLRLCERVVDGGTCVHCRRPSIFVADTDTAGLDQLCCVTAWDPELKTFRRGCEGDATFEHDP